MARHGEDAASLELLPTSQSKVSLEDGQHGTLSGSKGSDRALAPSSQAPEKAQKAYSGQRLWLPFAEATEALAFSVLIIAIIPIILLAVFAPRLASRLSSSSCLPNGEFIIPGTASIWNPRYIFTISIAFGNHSYTYVKIVDAIWDVVMGRGGQLILIWLAYRTFHKSLMYVMQTLPVPYSLYGAIAFDAGSLHSIFQFISVLSTSESKKSWRVIRIYITIIFCTVYIAAMPTLFSAMTGYAAVSEPSIEIVNGYERTGASPDYCKDVGNCTILPCGSSLQPVWAIVWDSGRYGQQEPYWAFAGTKEELQQNRAPAEYQYYMDHKSDYLAAANLPACRQFYNDSSLYDCAPLQKSSQIADPYDYGTTVLDPPLLNIDVLGRNAQGAPKAFECNGVRFFAKQINEGGADGISALCTAGSSYQWGFSFLLLLIVSVLNLVFAATMYGLWIDVRRNGDLKTIEEHFTASGGGQRIRRLNTPSNLRSALDISKQAEMQYGKEVHDWPSWKLESLVWRGKKGIRLQGVA